MTLNLNCCPNFNLGLGSLCSCKDKPRTESPEPINPVPMEPNSGIDATRDLLREPIVLVENEQIHFESMLPNHTEFLYLKILNDKKILAIAGGLIGDLKMDKDDLIDKDVCSVEKNQELFADFICTLVSRSLENGTAYQFCFKIGSSGRILCCSIYPCSIPGFVSSVDCIIRLVIEGFRPSLIDKFILPLDPDETENQKKQELGRKWRDTGKEVRDDNIKVAIV